MDTTALLSTKDQLAAKLRRKAPAHAQVNRVSFSHILSDSRDGAAAELRRAERAVSRSTSDPRPTQAYRPDRSSTDHPYRRPAEFNKDGAGNIDDLAEPFRSRRSAHSGSREATARGDTNQPAETHPTNAARASDRTGTTAGQGQETNAVAGQVPATVLPKLPTQGIELPAQAIMAETPNPSTTPLPNATPGETVPGQTAAAAPQPAMPVDPAGVALAGAAEDSTLPSLVAPLTQPTGETLAPSPIANQALAAAPAESQSTAAETASLVGALVGKTTARGQDRALGTPAQPVDATAPVPSEPAPAAPARPAVATPVLPIDATPEPILPQTAAAARPEIQEPAIRAALLPDGELARVAEGAVNGTPQSGASAPNGSTANTAAQLLRPVTDAQSQTPIQLLTDPATAPAQTPVAMAARIAADPAPATMDGIRSIADASLQNMTASSGTGASSSEVATRATAAQLARPAAPPTPVAEQVAVRISKAIAEGADRIEIRLKPASLGHVRVAMEVGHDGRVLAVVTADRPDTLDMLKQDSRSLERALQDAGLKTDSNSLSFNLRGGENRDANGQDAASGSGQPASQDEGMADDLPPDAIDPSRFTGGTGLVDIHV